MFNISDYLKRAVGLIDKNELSKHEISRVVEKHTTITLNPKDFEVKDGVVKTNISPLQRNIIIIKKQK